MLFGASHYEDEGLHDLPAVASNLHELAAVLGAERLGGFRRDSISVIEEPTNPAIGITIEREASLAVDTFLLYYAGHGIPAEAGGLLFALPSTNLEYPAWTSLDFQLVRKVLVRCPARNRILIIDCCFSGRALGTMADPASMIAGQTEIEGTYTLTSAAPNVPALAPVGAEYTAFTGALLQVLGQGLSEDLDLYPLGRLYPALRHHQQIHGFPLPQLRGTGLSNELALVRNAGRVAELKFDESNDPDNASTFSGELIPIAGIFTTDGQTHVIRTSRYSPGQNDVEVPSALVDTCQLRPGDAVTGAVLSTADKESRAEVPGSRKHLRDRADRSGLSVGSGVPAVGGPGDADQSSGDDDGVGQCDECVDDAGMSFGADGQLLEAAVVP